ncbi:MAG TPA: nuclear transport factor 2 family protein [Thermomicrobiales bacterium]|jgi:ketosteroid isomerase-like protein
MPVRSPEEMHPAFTAAFNAQDLDALLELYEEGAVITPQPGVIATGHAAIRGALGGFLALNGPITMTTKTVIPAGDLVLLHAEWTVNGTGPDGSPIALAARSSEVIRRQADGSWRYIIDNPYSVDAA